MNTYEVCWISPRGFANEGDYVYGTTEQLADEIDNGLADNGKWFDVSRHRSKEAAIRSAAKNARRVRRESPAHELCAVGIREAGKQQSQEDYERVVYTSANP